MALTNNSIGNCANVHAPNYTFPGLTSPACGVKSQDLSENVTLLLDTGCCEKGSPLYSDPAQPCIHYCLTSRSNQSFAQCVASFETVPGFDIEQFWCLNNHQAMAKEMASIAGRTAEVPLVAERSPRWKSAALLGFMVALGFCAM